LAEHLYFGRLDNDNARKELAVAQRALPNESIVFLLAGYIDRRQGRWDDSLKNMQQALSLDPRGPQTPFMLEQLSRTYDLLRRYSEVTALMDRALALAPNNPSLRYRRANIDLVSRGDVQPLKNMLRTLVAERPEAAADFAPQSFVLATYEHNWDEAAHALSVMPADGCRDEAFPFPRAWCDGVLARLRGDAEHARSAFVAARGEVEQIVQQQRDNAPALCVLGVVDAALGNKRDAVREAKRAAQLLPVTKDSIDGARVIKYLALTYAWTGKKDAALAELEKAARLPGYLSYGELKLDPVWDPIRDDPRFQKIVASLAPK
jgi:serine/threonine-protein kinase